MVHHHTYNTIYNILQDYKGFEESITRTLYFCSVQNEGVFCRICHVGDRKEVLISPCYCAGSMGLLHMSCLQRWLGSSNKTSCEICLFKFALQRRAMPISKVYDSISIMCLLVMHSRFVSHGLKLLSHTLWLEYILK